MRQSSPRQWRQVTQLTPVFPDRLHSPCVAAIAAGSATGSNRHPLLSFDNANSLP